MFSPHPTQSMVYCASNMFWLSLSAVRGIGCCGIDVPSNLALILLGHACSFGAGLGQVSWQV